MSKTLIMFHNTFGQEIIAEDVTPDTAKSGVKLLANLLVVTVVPQSASTYGLGLIPYSPSNPDGNWYVSVNDIVGVAETIPTEIEKAYLSRTSSIEIATSLSSILK